MRAEKSHINVHFSQHLDPALNIRRLNISLEQFKTQYPSAQIQGPYLKKSNPSHKFHGHVWKFSDGLLTDKNARDTKKQDKNITLSELQIESGAMTAYEFETGELQNDIDQYEFQPAQTHDRGVMSSILP